MASPQGFVLLLEQQVMATSHSNELSIFTLWEAIEAMRFRGIS